MLKYEEVALKIRTLLENGIYKTGERLPSLEQLKADYHVSKSTVIKRSKY